MIRVVAGLSFVCLLLLAKGVSADDSLPPFPSGTEAPRVSDGASFRLAAVDVQAPELDISGGITELDVPILDAAQLLRDVCSLGDLENSSSLTILPNSYVPPDPSSLQGGWGEGEAQQGASVLYSGCSVGAGR